MRTKAAPLTNLVAEKHLLGGLLKSETAFWHVSNLLRPDHFSNNIHQQIYSAVRDICTEGKRLSLALVSSRLPEEDDGGKSMPAYLSVLLANSEEGGSPLDYVDGVVETWARRRLIEMAKAIEHEALSGSKAAADVIADAAIKIADVSQGSEVQPAKELKEILQRVVGRANDAYQDETFVPGFDTGLPSLDEICGRFMPGDLIICGASQGDGKGQPLDALILTPFGFRKMGDMKVGCAITAPDGSVGNVIGVYPLGKRQLFRFTFHDGTSTEVTEDHIWLAWQTGHGRHIKGDYITGSRGQKLFTAAQIMGILEKNPKIKFKIPVASPVPFTRAGAYDKCLIDPYLLGVLLGDGALNNGMLCSADVEIIHEAENRLGRKFITYSSKPTIRSRALVYSIPVDSGVRTHLETMGLRGKLSHEKFIPKRYLISSEGERWDLLRGLMDTDGWVNVNGDPRYCTVSDRLADDVAFLARSLGAVVTRRVKPSHYKKDGVRVQCMDAHELRIKLWDGARAFNLRRKQAQCNKPQSLYRTLVNIEPTRVAEAQCIKVSNPSALYMTNDFIVTHNTALAAQIAMRAAQRVNVLFFQLEMQDEDMGRRMLAAESGLSVSEIEEGQFDFAAFDKLITAQRKIENSKLFIDDRPRLKMAQIRSRSQAMKNSSGLGMVLVDHLRLVQADGKVSDQYERTEYVTGSLKSLAKELKVPLICLAQRTRSSQGRDDPMPRISDFFGGGSIEQDADGIVALWRRDLWLRQREPRHNDEKGHDAWLKDIENCRNIIEAINLKRRRGGSMERRRFNWDGPATRLREINA